MSMTPDQPEFIVECWVTGDSGRFTVIGRCGDVRVPVGETFDLVFRNKPRRFPEEANDDPIRIEERPISLRVVCAHAYGKSLSGLSPAMTGSLVLDGDGTESIAAGWILGKRDWSRALIDSPGCAAIPTPISPV
jgi:hypothetical protein